MNDEQIQHFYQALLALTKNVPRTTRLSDPDATVTLTSRVCGSQITVDLKVERGVVTDYGQKVQACTLGTAAASIMGRRAVGRTGAELREVTAQLRAMLRENGPAPEGDWSDLAILVPARDLTTRHASMLLAFDAVVSALQELGYGGDENTPSTTPGEPPNTVRLPSP